MKNRKIYEFVIYPRIFLSLSILYKGSYCVSFKLYHTSSNNTTTYAYPFMLPNPNSEPSIDRQHEDASLHVESNFSFETERYLICHLVSS
jgi:hypothetical protein